MTPDSTWLPIELHMFPVVLCARVRREMTSDELRQKVMDLTVEHRDLDEVINTLTQAGAFDELMLKRLKKRKLQLKDAITRLESRLIPDLNA